MSTARTHKTVNLPFQVPASFDHALKTAAARVEDFKAETKPILRQMEKQVRSAADRVSADVSDASKKAQKEATRLAEDISRRVSKAVRSAVEGTLHSFNVPTRQELRSLTSKVDALGRKIDALHTRRVPKATKRARRAG